MKTSNIHLLREIDSIEELLSVDANELFVVKEIDTLTEQVRQLTGDYQSLELQAKQWLNGYKEFDVQNKELREQVRQLREALTNVLHAESHNTGHEPSLSVFHRAVDEALELLEAIK